MGKSKKVNGTKQTFQYIEKEPEKLHVKPIKCLNARQKEFLNSMKNFEVTITSGEAGCGKTFLACYYALKMLEKHEIEQIVLVKSVTTIKEEELGFLPGEILEKMEPFMQSFYGNITKIIGEDMQKQLIAQGKIKILPLAYVRGITIDESFIILDECQNINMNTFKSIITRIGKNSKYVIMGDVDQIDLLHRDQSALAKIIDLFKNDDKIGIVKFLPDDCVRNPLIPHILNKLKEYEQIEINNKNNKRNLNKRNIQPVPVENIINE